MGIILVALRKGILLFPSWRCQVHHRKFLFLLKQRLQLRAGIACGGRLLRLTILDERKVLAKIARLFIQFGVSIRFPTRMGVGGIYQPAV